MKISGNKGEWSELYTFFKLLADGRLYSADGKSNRYEDKYYPILKIFRDDSIDRNTYQIVTAKNNILVAGNNINIEIPQTKFKEESENILNFIKQMKDSSAEYNDIIPFLEEIGVERLKAKSQDKADIRIVIHNLHTGSKPELGYSIKSKLGAPSTLINSNKDGTNFIYEIQGINQENALIFNKQTKFKDKFNYLQSLGAKITYYKTAELILHNNLTMLDLGLEKILSEELLYYYSGIGKDIEDLTNHITAKDPLSIIGDAKQPMYSYKIKQFLLAFALGMTPTAIWSGKFNANGGYIVVKEDGDIICYHFFDRNDLEDYLYYNTRFDTPSTKRHSFGNIYKENNKWYLKLNIQVRFK